jgi:predicted transcriptional regulator
MSAVVKGERKAPADAGIASFESVEAIARLLTQENRHLLSVIDTEHPNSVAQLVKMVNRAEPNVSRSLAKLVAAGFVVMGNGDGRVKIPRIEIREITVKINALKQGDQIIKAH